MPDAMVTAYRVLRDDVLHEFAITNLNTLEVTHQDMPDAATACPGASVVDRPAELPTAQRTDSARHETSAATFGGLPIVAPGDRGAAVKRVHALLLAAGLTPGDLGGKYLKRSSGPTGQAIRAFQAASGCDATGLITLRDSALVLGVG
jgi:hypothetical protein